MRFMVSIRATKYSEAGVLPDETVISEMSKHKVMTSVRRHRRNGSVKGGPSPEHDRRVPPLL